MTTAHDAEEAMRPYLGRVYDAMSRPESLTYTAALADALDKACALLGVHR